MDDMTPAARENQLKITSIRYRLLQGLVTYDEARAEAQPVIDRMNARGAEIARKSGVKHRLFTFAVLVR
jgi:Fe2+ or Zn2+ uptake regulation protein